MTKHCILSVLGLAACSGGATTSTSGNTPIETGQPLVVSGNSQTITAGVGQEVDIMLSTVGPGGFDSLPGISAPRIQYLESAVVPPYLPSGPTQRFRFITQVAGKTILTFVQTNTPAPWTARTVEDTVVIR